MDRGKCLGFVAYYCNDAASRIAYITLILLAPEARGSGLAQHLTDMVLETARRRQFNACRLEVRKINAHAQAFYRKLGFEQIEERPIKYLMERRL
jgi:ribosomal protein S18 acetylase RimI-like enzyme